MVGLDWAGKTTILNKIRVGDIAYSLPEIGRNVEATKFKNITFFSWDVSGNGDLPSYWHSPDLNMEGLVFVVDSTDREHVSEAAKEFQRIIRNELRKEVDIVLVIANKQDLPNAMTVARLTDQLDLHSIAHLKWHIQPTCATTGDGLMEALDWLGKSLADKHRLF